MMIIDTTNEKKKKKVVMMRVSPEFHNTIFDWINDGTFNSSADATKKLTPIISSMKWSVNIKPRKKPQRVRFSRLDKSKRRKIELEFG